MRLVPLLLVSAAALSFNGCRQPVKPQPAPAPAPTRPANGAPAPTPGTPTPNSPAPGGSGSGGAQPGGGGAPGGGANAGGATPAPRAYATVITPRAKSKTGIFGVHMVGTSLFFEIPASEMGKDFVAVSTLAATPAGIGINGTLLDDRLVRFERRENRVYHEAHQLQHGCHRQPAHGRARDVVDRVLSDHRRLQCRNQRSSVAMIRWLPSPVADAVGPSTVDPRTGEIIDADVQMS